MATFALIPGAGGAAVLVAQSFGGFTAPLVARAVPLRALVFTCCTTCRRTLQRPVSYTSGRR